MTRCFARANGSRIVISNSPGARLGHLALDRRRRCAMAAAGVRDEKEQAPHPLTVTAAATSVRGAKSVIDQRVAAVGVLDVRLDDAVGVRR